MDKEVMVVQVLAEHLDITQEAVVAVLVELA
jgi:hypothetical protein